MRTFKFFNWVRCERCKRETLVKFKSPGKIVFRCKCGAQIRHEAKP